MAVDSWRSIVTLVFFIIANAIVIHPLTFLLPIPNVLRDSFFWFASIVDAEGTKRNNSVDLSTTKSSKLRIQIDYVTAPVIIVFFLWALSAIDANAVRQGITGANGVQPLSIMALFISLAYLSVSLDKTGLFGFLAVWVARRGKSSGRRLYLLLYTFFFSCAVLFGNDPVILSGTPFLAHFVRYSGIDPPAAWILAQFIPANTASAILPPSNPTNLVITSAFSISFLSFAAHTVIPTILVAFAQYILLRYIQFNSSKFIPKNFSLGALQSSAAREDPEKSGNGEPSTLSSTSERDHVGELSDKAGAIFGSVLFISTLLILLGTSVKKVPVWWVTVPSAIAMAIRDILHDKKHWRTRDSEVNSTQKTSSTTSAEERSQEEEEGSSARWPVLQRMRIAFETRLPTISKVVQGLPIAMLPFAFAMFILVQALTVSGWIDVFSKWWSVWVTACGPSDSLRAVTGATFEMFILSILMCNFCGTNIGATIFLSQIVSGWINSSNSSGRPIDPRVRLGTIYALALGSNFGAYSFAFSASLAGLLWRNILKNNGINRIKVRQRDFVLQNIPSTVTAIVIGAVSVLVEVLVTVK